MYAERGAPTSWNDLGQPVIVAQPLTAHPLLSVYQQQVGVNAHEFWVRRPGKETLKFDFKVFDDPILCPMVRPAVPVIRRRLHSTDRPCFGRRQGLFDPRVFDLETKLTERERGRPSSVEDEVDGTFLLDQPVRTCVFPSMTSPFRLQELPLMPIILGSSYIPLRPSLVGRNGALDGPPPAGANSSRHKAAADAGRRRSSDAPARWSSGHGNRTVSLGGSDGPAESERGIVAREGHTRRRRGRRSDADARRRQQH
jgi:hypothetical protein